MTDKTIPLSAEGQVFKLFSRAIHDYAKGHDRIYILDAGCGRRWTLDLNGLDYHLTGIDNNETVLRIRCEERGDLDEWICADLRTAPLTARNYDVIHSSFALEHIDGAEAVLERLVSVLKPGGLLLLRIPDRRSVYAFLTRITPHRMHVWYKRWVNHNKNAGKPGHGPWPTAYDPIICHQGISQFCRSHGLVVDTEYSDNSYLRFFGVFRGPVDAMLRLIALASFGHLTADHNNLSFVIVKPPAAVPAPNARATA